MKTKYHRHCCPACGQRVGWSRLNLRAWIWARWKCESCGTELRFSSASRWLCALLSGGWFVFLDFFVLRHVAVWVWFIILCVGIFAIFRLDRIIVAKPAEASGEHLDAIPHDA